MDTKLIRTRKGYADKAALTENIENISIKLKKPFIRDDNIDRLKELAKTLAVRPNKRNKEQEIINENNDDISVMSLNFSSFKSKKDQNNIYCQYESKLDSMF